MVADAPTSGYEKPEPFCFEMKLRISYSEGDVRRNNGMVTLPRNANFVDGHKLAAICSNKAAYQFSGRKQSQLPVGRLESSYCLLHAT